MKEQINQKRFIKIISLFVIIIIIAGFFIWLKYKTLNPCHIFKEEVWSIMMAKPDEYDTDEEALLYFSIDKLNPLQCISGIVATKSGTEAKLLNKKFEVYK